MISSARCKIPAGARGISIPLPLRTVPWHPGLCDCHRLPITAAYRQDGRTLYAAVEGDDSRAGAPPTLVPGLVLMSGPGISRCRIRYRGDAAARWDPAGRSPGFGSGGCRRWPVGCFLPSSPSAFHLRHVAHGRSLLVYQNFYTRLATYPRSFILFVHTGYPSSRKNLLPGEQSRMQFPPLLSSLIAERPRHLLTGLPPEQFHYLPSRYGACGISVLRLT